MYGILAILCYFLTLSGRFSGNWRILFRVFLLGSGGHLTEEGGHDPISFGRVFAGRADSSAVHVEQEGKRSAREGKECGDGCRPVVSQVMEHLRCKHWAVKANMLTKPKELRKS